MPEADQIELTEDAREIIAEEGRIVKFIRFGNPSSEDPRLFPKETLDGPIVSVQPRSDITLGRSISNKDLIEKSDQIWLYSPVSTTETDLTLFDEALDEGQYYALKYWEVLKPGAVSMLYFIGVVKA